MAVSASAGTIPVDSLVGRDNHTAENTAAIAMLAVAPKLWSYCSADIVGRDIFAKRYPSPDDCVTNCLPSTGCNAGTWTDFEGGTCYFKRLDKKVNVFVDIVPKAGAVSFMRTDDVTPSKQPYVLSGTDLPGNDIATLPAKQVVDCRNLCEANEKCHAWSWSFFDKGTCWLKSKSSTSVAVPGVTSGIIPFERNAAYCLAYL